MAAIDNEAAIVLKSIPENSTTIEQLVAETGLNSENLHAAVDRLLALGLIQVSGAKIGITPFAHKARSLFNIVP
jgi:hypothetical protein